MQLPGQGRQWHKMDYDEYARQSGGVYFRYVKHLVSIFTQKAKGHSPNPQSENEYSQTKTRLGIEAMFSCL